MEAKMNFVTGEKLQETAEITIALNTENNFNSDLVKTQIKNTKTKCYIFCPTKTDTKLPEELISAKTIFVYTHILDYFFNYIFPHIREPITLITHNSDHGVDEKYLQYLNSNKIKKWFCQNKYTTHPKLFSLPIGIANSQWPHGNVQILENIIKSDLSKNNLALKAFDISTNTGHRQQINLITEQNGFTMSPPLAYTDYLKQLKQSYFCFAPHGNGADCHRIWECLYLNCVPIVPERHPSFEEFKHLPILFVDSYENITKTFLEQQIEKFFPFSKYNLEMLNINYWENLINN
jgi:hypothetical protein